MIYEEPKLSDYALIGNGCAAALVSKNGSIDWCCLPEFHSASVFAALLDKKKGGYFSIAPSWRFESSQTYLPDTNVVATNFKTSAGEVRILDAFTAMKEEDKVSTLFPDHEILRIVEGISGNVKMTLAYSPRIFYGKTVPELKDNKKLGIKFSWKEDTYIFISTLKEGQIKVDNLLGSAIAEFNIQQGENAIFSLSYSNQSPAVIPELRTTGLQRMNDTIAYWKDWIAVCKYSGVYQEQVKRSALTLKLLAHAPSGSIIAAPTTSLPEKIGGERNWDYRYCWLRDASFTIRVLLKLGFKDEAHAYINWILHATRLTQPKLQVVYSVYGHSRLEEKILDWLDGYKNSKPVRIGNKADAQFQLDVYGEVLDAVFSYAQIVKEFDRVSRRFIIGLGKVICKLWREPDNGIWEIRSPEVRHTHSLAIAWVGLDRLVKLCNKYAWNEAPLKDFKDALREINNEIEKFGFNDELNSYTRELHGDNLDASLLTLSLVGYCDYNSPRMVSTVKNIKDQLSNRSFIYRYRNIDDGIEGDESSFAICNFWMVENLVKSGHIDEGIKMFETVLKTASPAGLLSEQIDPESYELLGNYPQAFTHIGLINTAMSIDSVLKE
jgi:GH15 family glucan-1,4-alpha-glucosidase